MPRRRRPDPDQALFPWVWAADPADERLDAPDDDEPAPLADRVRRRHGPYVVELWGVPVTVGRRQPNRPEPIPTVS